MSDDDKNREQSNSEETEPSKAGGKSLAILKIVEEESGPVKEKKFPAGNVRPFDNEFRVYFEKNIYEDMIAHAFENDKIELGGVLVGEVRKDQYGAYLYVKANIRGKFTESSVAQVTFTQETWNYINDIKDKKYSDWKIVGWYHTHPNFGIFLSEMDEFIHNNFFGAPWQIAFVVDPINDSAGCFVKNDEAITVISRFWSGKKKLESARDKTEKELILDRLDNLENKLKEAIQNLTVAEEAQTGGGSFFSMAGWMIAIVLMIFMLMQNVGIVGSPGGKDKDIGYSIRKDEILLATQKETLQLSEDKTIEAEHRVYISFTPLTSDEEIYMAEQRKKKFDSYRAALMKEAFWKKVTNWTKKDKNNKTDSSDKKSELKSPPLQVDIEVQNPEQKDVKEEVETPLLQQKDEKVEIEDLTEDSSKRSFNRDEPAVETPSPDVQPTSDLETSNPPESEELKDKMRGGVPEPSPVDESPSKSYNEERGKPE